ncbi:MAG: hypothetical protein QHD01_34695 [Bradyrhizobium sp.]|nr:hypothetical protein [Bradyrhizobium sp.]MDX3971723.1 hypothetical protein [Bradyrhizobium sp.]
MSIKLSSTPMNALLCASDWQVIAPDRLQGFDKIDIRDGSVRRC